LAAKSAALGKTAAPRQGAGSSKTAAPRQPCPAVTIGKVDEDLAHRTKTPAGRL
jgi:hypothetical protein